MRRRASTLVSNTFARSKASHRAKSSILINRLQAVTYPWSGFFINSRDKYYELLLWTNARVDIFLGEAWCGRC